MCGGKKSGSGRDIQRSMRNIVNTVSCVIQYMCEYSVHVNAQADYAPDSAKVLKQVVLPPCFGEFCENQHFFLQHRQMTS